VFACRPTRGEEEWIPVDPNFSHGVDLVSYIALHWSSRPNSASAWQVTELNPRYSYCTHSCFLLAYPDGHDKEPPKMWSLII